jgi:membrane protein required for colicin V production
MIWADYAILTIVGISVVISLLRGFVREAISLAALLAGIWMAVGYAEYFSKLMSDYISLPSARIAIAAALLFIIALLAGALINYLAGQLVRKSGLSGTDRMIGVLFGVARGVVIVALLVLMAGLTPLPRDPWWHESVFIGHIQPMAEWIKGVLPEGIGSHISFDPVAST